MLSIPLLLARNHEMKTWPVILQKPRVGLLYSHHCETKRMGTEGKSDPLHACYGIPYSNLF